MLSLPEPGTPFHRLARTEAHRWWRPVVGTLILAVAWFGSLPALAVAVDAVSLIVHEPTGVNGALRFSPTSAAWLSVLTVGLLLPAALLAARDVQNRPVGTLASVTGRVRLGWLGGCLLVAAVTTVGWIAGGELVYEAMGDGDNGTPVGAGKFGRNVLIFLAPTVLMAVALEYAFRGWLLQAVGGFSKKLWPAIAVQAVLYAAAFGTDGPWSFADWLVTGAVLGWLAVRTGGLEAGIALMTCLYLTGLGYDALYGWLTYFGPYDDLDWQIFVLNLVVNLVYAAVVTRLARRRGIVTVSAEPAAGSYTVGSNVVEPEPV
ncbi:CPBP family intramembrane glutamic endopeptidase [Dactylosporangium sp. NPDC006015]|uniref:CPBP family intramembrane glutamic endopeptidase n=1 Tax=Dactylosporangium sp. NPDC006015 TaxID=3154576 RepID=UPI0033BDC6E8